MHAVSDERHGAAIGAIGAGLVALMIGTNNWWDCKRSIEGGAYPPQSTEPPACLCLLACLSACLPM